MPVPIDPALAVSGPEWSLGGVEPAVPGPAGEGGGGFGGMLAEQISNLEQLQVEAADASRALATGSAEDITAVVNSVERAKLSMEVASTIRMKAVEAYQEVFRTTV